MKVKEIEKTVNLAWSPKTQYPILLAAGTAAQQLDASFNTSAALELYSINFGDPSLDLDLCHTVPSDYRFHKLVWGYSHTNDMRAGLIVGGCDSGRILIYDAAKLLNKDNGIVATLESHSGAVRALDFNSFQKNLLASGSSDSEIYIWDLNNLKTPMTPGSAAQPPDDVVSVSWNKQVQHILTTTFPARCMVWDLRKNEPIIKLSDSTARSRWKVVTWNPQVATQLCLASEEDHYPVIQLWDLRFATSPVKIFEGHEKGVLSVAWCYDDPDLLISCGKDNKLLVWNPNTDAQKGEIVCDMTIGTHWNFEVNWCPRNPFLVSTSSFDSRASIYSLSGGKPAAPTSNKIADSFPGMNQYPQSLPPQQMHQQQQPVIELLKPPRWMKKPVGVSFGFGGKLVSFGSQERNVYVSQVVTESDLMLRFKELESLLEEGNLFNHCYSKAEATSDPQIKEIWHLIAGQFYGESFKNQVFLLLGTSEPSLNSKLSTLNIKDDIFTPLEPVVNDTFSNASRIGPSDGVDVFDSIATESQNLSNSLISDYGTDCEILRKPIKFPKDNDVEEALCDALSLGKFDIAVKLFIHMGEWAQAIALAVSGGPDLLAKTMDAFYKKNDHHLNSFISAVVNKDWYSLVETCELISWKKVLVTLLTHAKDAEFRILSELLGLRLLEEGDSSLKKSALICFVCAGNVNQLLNNWSLYSNGADDVQELVEVGLIVKEAMQHRGITVEVSGALANVLVKYAELLASQGYLTAAYTYLGESQEENIQMLRDRLAIAIGVKTAYPTKPEAPTMRNNAYFASQRPPSKSNVYSSTYTSGFPSSAPYNAPLKPPTKPPPVNQVPPLPQTTEKLQPFIQHSMNPPMPSVPPASNGYSVFKPGSVIQSGQSFPNSTPSSYPSTNNLFGPSSQSSISVGLSSTTYTFTSSSQPQPSMYSQPSVSNIAQPSPPPPGKPPSISSFPTSAPPSVSRTSHTPPGPPPTSQVPYNNAKQTPDHVAGQTKTKYVLDPSVQGGGPRGSFSSLGSFQNVPPIMSQSPFNPNQSFSQQIDSSVYQMQNQNTFYPATQQNTSSGAFVSNANLALSNLPSSSPITFDQSKVAQIPPSAPGWNDPPLMMYEKVHQNQSSVVQPINPITHPMYGSPPEENGIRPSQGMPPNSFQNNIPPMQAGSYVAAPPSCQNNLQATSVPPVPSVGEVKPKIPLPEQHVHLQTVLEELRNQCYCKTNNPQMKRKLDDVARKLEMLYDFIRENKISAQTLSGLHEIVNAIQRANYQDCLRIHTELVSGPDFSTIASFMPGIKMLVQSALQLDVYL